MFGRTPLISPRAKGELVPFSGAGKLTPPRNSCWNMFTPVNTCQKPESIPSSERLSPVRGSLRMAQRVKQRLKPYITRERHPVLKSVHEKSSRYSIEIDLPAPDPAEIMDRHGLHNSPDSLRIPVGIDDHEIPADILPAEMSAELL
jgi:hypothetical protein